MRELSTKDYRNIMSWIHKQSKISRDGKLFKTWVSCVKDNELSTRTIDYYLYEWQRLLKNNLDGGVPRKARHTPNNEKNYFLFQRPIGELENRRATLEKERRKIEADYEALYAVANLKNNNSLTIGSRLRLAHLDDRLYSVYQQIDEIDRTINELLVDGTNRHFAEA